MHQGEVQLEIELSQQWGLLPYQVAFLLGLWTLLTHFTNNKEANMGLEQRNKSKLLTLLGQPACLTALRGNWRTGCSLGFLHTVSQSGAVIWGHMTHTQVFSQVMLEHLRWRGYQPNLRFFHPWRSGILTQR